MSAIYETAALEIADQCILEKDIWKKKVTLKQTGGRRRVTNRQLNSSKQVINNF